MRSLLCLALLAGCSDGTTTTVTPGDGGIDEGIPDAGGPLLLLPGEVVELAVSDDGTAGEWLATPAGDEQFVLILGSTDFELVNDALPFTVTFGAAEKAGPTTRITTCSLSSTPWSATPPTVDPPPIGPGPAVDSTRSLDVPTPSGVSTIVARALAVGEHAVVWADTTHPTTLDTTFVAEFLDDFESLIMPRARTVFGTEPDLDEDGRIHLVFSPLTYETAVAFFTGCDLDDTAGCPTSNRGEVLYLTPPDAIDPPYNTPRAIKEILAHELSHLLHFNRKVLANELTAWPDSGYMIEGIGALAQDVTGYQAGNLYVTMAGLDGIEEFSLAETLTDGRPYDTARDGVLRGVSYLFARFLYDRAGGDAVDSATLQSLGGPSFLRALIDAPESMAEALPNIAEASAADVAMDFFTALAMSNREELGGTAPVNPCFAYLPTESDPITSNQRGASLAASFHGLQMDGPYVGDPAAPDPTIRRGGVELLQVDALPGATDLAFTVNVHPQAAPRVRVGRWK